MNTRSLNVHPVMATADDQPAIAGASTRWIATQGAVDLMALLGLSALKGTSIADTWADPATKYIVVGPAMLAFGTIATRFHKRERPGFDDDPIVRALGGADSVRRLRDSWEDALRF